jgi:hypothetical protein
LSQEWCHQGLPPAPCLKEAQSRLDESLQQQQLQQQQQQPSEAAAPSKQQRVSGLSLVCLDQELEGAYHEHLQARQHHTLF